MPCYHPLHGYRAVGGGITFKKGGSTGLDMQVPCGQCIGCRLERSRQWAVRCMHEASLHSDNCFITLTYADEYVPEYGSLDRSAFPKFMKRLRKRGLKARYFHCGEYGELSGRPHYHACLFGCRFDDRYVWSVRNGLPVWRSAVLESLWPYGQSEVGTLTFESAAYVARYVTKKVTGKMADEHYERVNPFTGEVFRLEPEYATMSRRPGIGRGWIEKYTDDVYPSDEVIVRGRSCKPARYYDTYFEGVNPDAAAAVFRRRLELVDKAEATPERLHVREVCTKARLNLYKGARDVEGV